MIYKITPNRLQKSDSKLKSKFVSLPDNSSEDVLYLVGLSMTKIWYNGHKSIKPVNPKDPEFIRYAKKDISKLESEIEEKQLLIKELKHLLK